MAAADPDTEVQAEFPPLVRQYKSGRVVRFGATDTVPASTDDTAGTGVTSKDVVINPSSGLWARLYLPAALPAAGQPVLGGRRWERGAYRRRARARLRRGEGLAPWQGRLVL